MWDGYHHSGTRLSVTALRARAHELQHFMQLELRVLLADTELQNPLQSAQRSKARKLRHIMQLEDEVQSLQGLTQQQAARIGALQQDNALLSEHLSGRACCPCTHACRQPALPTILRGRG